QLILPNNVTPHRHHFRESIFEKRTIHHNGHLHLYHGRSSSFAYTPRRWEDRWRSSLLNPAGWMQPPILNRLTLPLNLRRKRRQSVPALPRKYQSIYRHIHFPYHGVHAATLPSHHLSLKDAIQRDDTGFGWPD